MGGKKRPTLSQLAKKAEKEKAQTQKKKEVKKEEAPAKRTVQLLDEKTFQTIAREVKEAKVITPYEVASKYGIKMSVALKVLRTLRERGDLMLVSKGHRTEIYIPRRG